MNKKGIGTFDLVVLLLLCVYCWAVGFAQLPSGKSCFCKLSGSVDECECSVGSVDEFNNQKLFPLLQNLLERDFFRYYKVDLEKACPFWDDERMCTSEKCGIETCDHEVPQGLREPHKPNESREKYSAGAQEEPCDSSNTFDPLDSTISGTAKAQFEAWAEFDDSENKFCDIDDDNSENMHYVDLTRNPERYTGYVGKSAQQVWKSIYSENCFKPNPKFDKNFLLHPTITGLCLEKRVFFRLISGLHTSITISIAAHSYKPAPGGFGQGSWFRNVDMFKWRFSPESTNEEGPQRLRNLYFVYLLELRALHKVAPYLSTEFFYTGDEKEDEESRALVAELTKIINDFPDHFDETQMFQGIESRARELREEFRQHFVNISRIMDCVGCDKCRLWGKLQTHGIGAALKILFSNTPRTKYTNGNPHVVNGRNFQLTRNEVVALFNSFGRFASSIREIAEFRRAMEHPPF